MTMKSKEDVKDLDSAILSSTDRANTNAEITELEQQLGSKGIRDVEDLKPHFIPKELRHKELLETRLKKAKAKLERHEEIIGNIGDRISLERELKELTEYLKRDSLQKSRRSITHSDAMGLSRNVSHAMEWEDRHTRSGKLPRWKHLSKLLHPDDIGVACINNLDS